MTPIRRYATAAAAVFATVRFVFVAASSRSATYGDFAATLPGAYAEHLNPTLWNSPDLAHSWAFHGHSYLHGPTQFLTLFPIVFLNSYAAIAAVLLVAYAVVIGLTLVAMWQMLTAVERKPASRLGVYTTTLLFFPLLQAYGQREFEIVILFAATLLLAAAVRDRQSLVGTLVAYIAWFKYLPIALVAYLCARRWMRALIWFVLASIVWLGLAHAIFGLQNFVYHTQAEDIPMYKAAVSHFPLVPGRADLCRAIEPVFDPTATTQVSVRWALCTLVHRGWPLPLPATYLGLMIVPALVFAWGFIRLERRGPLSPPVERWRRALELSIAITVATTFLFAHYYYLAVLILPLNVLLARVRGQPNPRVPFVVWLAAYVCLSPFVVPISVLDRMLHIHAWSWYMGHAIYFYGIVLLVGLLEYEYLQL